MPYARSTICMPGRQVVAFSAASVSWLIAMPGAISMNSGGLLLERHEPGAHRLQESGELRLQRIDHGERTKLHRADAITGRRQPSPITSGWATSPARRRVTGTPGR